MRWVRTMTQGVKKENVESAKLRLGRVGNFAEIGEIRSRTEAVSDDRLAAVKHFNWLEARPEQLDGAVQFLQVNLRQCRVIGIAVEDVLEYAFDLLRSRGASIKWNRSLLMAKAQGPQIVEPKNVVGVGVGIKHGVHSVDALAN